MPINITNVLKQGYGRTVKRNGLMLVGIIFVISVVNGVVGVSVRATPTALAPSLAAGLVSVVLSIALLVVSIAAIRVFVSDETERLPREFFTRNMVWAAVNVFIGMIVFGIIVALGLVALIVPGIFLLVTLAFWTVYVAVEDQNFVKAFRSSWGLTRGYRFNLLVLGVAVILLTILVTIAFGFGDLASGSFVGDVVALVFAQAASAITTVFSTAVLARAYTELNTPDEGDIGETTSNDAPAERPVA
ncbi:hypothetical protein [Haladaptatus sp. DYF46]|uniref:hypothetical protein n=1 Tax=Haladaptatus sp. DYF46 TaxID=2886041 RepID=UPI001E304BD0|nr:hypothetical protein [Haladaptatus sp. DYF46]